MVLVIMSRTHQIRVKVSESVIFFNTIFVSSHNYVPENPEGTQVIVDSMNMEYISDTVRNRTHNLFRPKQEPIPLGHCDGNDYNTYNIRCHSCPAFSVSKH